MKGVKALAVGYGGRSACTSFKNRANTYFDEF